VRGLADALGRVLDDGAWRRDLGTNARRRVEEAFALPAVGDQLRAFLTKDGQERSRSRRPDPRLGVAERMLSSRWGTRSTHEASAADDVRPDHSPGSAPARDPHAAGHVQSADRPTRPFGSVAGPCLRQEYRSPRDGDPDDATRRRP
jgi:hypothetical protein